MARRFRGESTCKVDGKGRFFLPPLFRRAVEDGDANFTAGGKPELVIVYGDPGQPFLEGFTMAAIEELDARIDRLPSGDLKRSLKRVYSSQAVHAEVDAEGRILLPPKPRERLGQTTDLMLVGMGETFEIWPEALYDRRKADEVARDIGLPAGLTLRDAMDAELARAEGR